MAGIYSQGGSAGHRYAGWLSEVEAKNFTFGGKVFNGSPSAIYVGSNQVWPWLTIAAQQAILGAFGQTDGKAVIKATNAYLNQLAASDRDKATALAGFINTYAVEDAHIVYSLVPTLGVVRWCAGDGTYGFSTGYIPIGYDHEFFTRFKLLASGQQGKGVWGKGDYLHQIANAVYLTSWFTSGFPNLMMWGWQGQHGGWRGDTSGSKYDCVWDVKMSFSQTKVNLDILRDGEPNQNTDYTTVVNFANDNIPLYLFKGSAFGNCKCAISEHYDIVNGVYKEYFIPYIKNNVGGMIDMVSGVFFGHSSFTISETPSTP